MLNLCACPGVAWPAAGLGGARGFDDTYDASRKALLGARVEASCGPEPRAVLGARQPQGYHLPVPLPPQVPSSNGERKLEIVVVVVVMVVVMRLVAVGVE